MGAVAAIIAFSVGVLAIFAWLLALFVFRNLDWIATKNSAIKQTEKPYPDEVLLQGIAMFVDDWAATFGDRDTVAEVCDKLRITWYIAEDFPLPEPYKIRAYGWNPSRFALHIATRHSDNIAHTALFHELVHVALRVTVGTPDGDHELPNIDAWHKEHTALERRVERKFAEWWAEQSQRGNLEF